MTRGRKPMTEAGIENRFLTHIDRTEDDCWLWNGKIDTNGYGILGRWKGNGGKWVSVHRYAWAKAFGPIPEGLFVLHHCDVRHCVRTTPSSRYPNGHLFLGTAKDNYDDCARKGRRPQGRPRVVLTRAIVEEIRALAASGRGAVSLSPQFGIGRKLIHKIVREDLSASMARFCTIPDCINLLRWKNARHAFCGDHRVRLGNVFCRTFQERKDDPNDRAILLAYADVALRQRKSASAGK